MADNTQLNPGQGGAVLRTLQDATGKHWPAGLQAFTVTASDGANVLQLVDAAHGLPVEIVGGGGSSGPSEVEQADEALLNATVYQGGAWVTQLAPGQSVGIAGTVTVSQSGPVSISGTVPVSLAAPIAATQSGSWITGLAPGTEVKLASGSSTAITGTVTVAQSGPVSITGVVPVSIADPVSISGTVPVSIASAVTVAQPNAANLKMTATLASGSTVGLVAGSALIGKTAAGADGSTLYNGTTALTPKFAKIDAASPGDNAVLAAVPGKKIRVLSWGFTAGGATTAKWRSGTTDITGPRKLTEFASAGQSLSEFGHFETATGQPLYLHLSAAVACGGNLTYVEV